MPPEQLKSFLNLMTLEGLSQRSFEDIKNVGYHGVQFASPATQSEVQRCHQLSLGVAASGRINESGKTKPLAERLAGEGFVCATLHVGWGLEDAAEGARLIESVLTASSIYKLPLYIETHRATIFQDMWRTVEFVRQFPEIRFNGDFSHWYTGQEMVYGGFENKLQFIQPVLERVRFVHGRIGNPGCMQVRVDPNQDPEPEYVTHFRQLWTACFRYGARIFAPELLAPRIYYARSFPGPDGNPVEESDRWEQSLILKRIAEECFEHALD